MWTYGLGGSVKTFLSKTADLDNDGSVDVIFFKGDFQKSIILFRNNRTVYGVQDCAFNDINGDGFSEILATSNRGLEVYDRVGNLIWNIKGADFRQIYVGEKDDGEKLIAVSIGIFAIDLPPQVRIYSCLLYTSPSPRDRG